MIDDETKKRLFDLCNKPVALGGWLGMPYEEDACISFVARFYQEMGIKDADVNALKQARNFIKVDKPQFGDVVVWREPDVIFQSGEFHLGVMLDYRKAVQCVGNTNGVGKVDISRWPWNAAFKGFYRHKSCF